MNVLERSQVTGVYEGGLKIWECSIDLATFLTSSIDFDVVGKKAKVLELGCGAGIPGIVAKHLGAEQVDFQVTFTFFIFAA